MVVSSGKRTYAIELKISSESRADRVLPLLSQACLEASWHAKGLNVTPLAIVQIRELTESLRRHLKMFHERVIPDFAVGLISEDGEAIFLGKGLKALNYEIPDKERQISVAQPHKVTDLFTDLNQWMMKLLLAPELPEQLLAGPRKDYRNASQLADTASASPMSASRFVRALQEEGFLEHSGRSYRLVRRRELFSRWKSVASRSCPELRMVYLVRERALPQALRVSEETGACIGLFAAADLLDLGHVTGVPTYFYATQLKRPRGWSELIPAQPGEFTQVIIRQANFPLTTFKPAIPTAGGGWVSDVLQIWLDTSSHPTRGKEQADHLANGVLRTVLRTAS